MISRRFLRLKAFQILYAYYKAGDLTIKQAEDQLYLSIHKAYELYYLLAQLPVELVDLASRKIEIARNKKIPTETDLNPNTRFVDNKLIAQLRENEQLRFFCKKNKLGWDDNPELIKNIYSQLIDTEFYHNYMTAEVSNYEEDKRFISKFYTKVLPYNEMLYVVLEDKSIFWNDEAEFIMSIMGKTIKDFKESDGIYAKFLSQFKDYEDEIFVKELFNDVLRQHKNYEKIIGEHTKNWDVDRIAFVDILIMQLAISEMLQFPKIPTKVTFNEYLEIAKHYSTEKSSIFVNGILDKIKETFEKENKLIKQ